jgi:hypothetical protein
MIERATEYEADLVVGWPGVGVAVIEVKGGHISRDQARWYQSSGGETHPIKDPVVQAQDCRHVLLRLLARYGSEAAAARFAHLVAFPFTGIGPGWFYTGCTRHMILANGDLPAAAKRIRTAIDRRGHGYAPLTGMCPRVLARRGNDWPGGPAAAGKAIEGGFTDRSHRV